MANVREATFDLFRKQGMTTIFGNPGSTELPMLSQFPDDFTYILGLQEIVAVGMADGYAQASGRPAHVNLHTAPGVGNGMGAIFNAQANKSPLLVTAGQQARSLVTVQANLTNRDATRMPHPLVKWSYEPPRAEDVPHALARATHLAALPPPGPVFVSIPMDDWGVEVDDDVKHQTGRSVSGGGAPDAATTREIARKLNAAERPALIAGPDIDTWDGWDAAVALVEHQRMAVWATPAPGGGRIGFPENHPAFQGLLPPAIGPAGEVLGNHDFVLAVGTSVFPYYPNIPGPPLHEGTELIAITNDPDEAARALVGDAIVADIKLTLEALVAEAGRAERGDPTPLPAPEPGEETSPLTPTMVHSTLAEVFPDDGIVALESPSSTLSLRNQLRLSKPGSYYFGAGGGLGFALAASVGVALAQPDRRVICVLGEGSAQYSIQTFWSAATYGLPVTFLILNNNEYAILKWFAGLEDLTGAPGLDLPALDTAACAQAYGVPAQKVEGREELREALRRAIDSDGPALVEVPVTPGMALF